MTAPKNLPRFCVYCAPIPMEKIKGTIFHPIGRNRICSNCGRNVKQGQIVILMRMKW